VAGGVYFDTPQPDGVDLQLGGEEIADLAGFFIPTVGEILILSLIHI